jgi:hypothetical protein
MRIVVKADSILEHYTRVEGSQLMLLTVLHVVLIYHPEAPA